MLMKWHIVGDGTCILLQYCIYIMFYDTIDEVAGGSSSHYGIRASSMAATVLTRYSLALLLPDVLFSFHGACSFDM